MKRYIKASKEKFEITYLVPENVSYEFRKYLDNMSGFDDVEYDIQTTPDGRYQFDCNITFNTKFGIDNTLHSLGYKKVLISDNVYEVVSRWGRGNA